MKCGNRLTKGTEENVGNREWYTRERGMSKLQYEDQRNWETGTWEEGNGGK